MSENINNLMFEFFDIKYQKSLVIKKQQYEKAAMLRDSERKVGGKLFDAIFTKQPHDWKLLDEWLNIHLKDNYGLDYNDDIDNLKLTIREIKLKQLGIN
jgi:hypothetical protein